MKEFWDEQSLSKAEDRLKEMNTDGMILASERVVVIVSF